MGFCVKLKAQIFALALDEKGQGDGIVGAIRESPVLKMGGSRTAPTEERNRGQATTGKR